MRFTKKYMVEDYERLYKHADLLELYLYDSSTTKHDALERSQGITVKLWRATGAAGGYVTVHDCTVNIWYLDDAIKLFNERPSEHNAALRISLERLRVARQRL